MALSSGASHMKQGCPGSAGSRDCEALEGLLQVLGGEHMPTLCRCGPGWHAVPHAFYDPWLSGASCCCQSSNQGKPDH